MTPLYADCRRRLQKASEFIGTWDTLHPGYKIVLGCRVSTYPQQNAGTLDDQEFSLRQAAQLAGLDVVDVVRRTGNGADIDWLDRVAEIAEACGATSVFESTDRVYRPRFYHPSRFPLAQATGPALRDVITMMRGTKIVTLVHPDATPWEVRAFQVKRGQMTSTAGGRPMRKKNKRLRLIGQAIAMSVSGASLREICLELNVSLSTLFGWLKRPR